MQKKQGQDFTFMVVLIVVFLLSLGLLTILILVKLAGTHIPWMSIASSIYSEASALVACVISGLAIDKEAFINLICGLLKERGASKKETALTLYANSIEEGTLVYIYKGVIKPDTLDSYEPIAVNPMANHIEDQHRECLVSFALEAGGYTISLSPGQGSHRYMHITISNGQNKRLNADTFPLV